MRQEANTYLQFRNSQNFPYVFQIIYVPTYAFKWNDNFSLKGIYRFHEEKCISK